MKRETGALFEKASRAILAGKVLLRRGDADFAAGHSYYAMFYTASALLIERGLRVGGRGAVQRAFGEYFVKTGGFDPSFHRWLLDAHDRRIAGDYRVEMRMAEDDVRRALRQAQAFLLEARRYLDRRPTAGEHAIPQKALIRRTSEMEGYACTDA